MTNLNTSGPPATLEQAALAILRLRGLQVLRDPRMLAACLMDTVCAEDVKYCRVIGSLLSTSMGLRLANAAQESPAELVVARGALASSLTASLVSDEAAAYIAGALASATCTLAFGSDLGAYDASAAQRPFGVPKASDAGSVALAPLMPALGAPAPAPKRPAPEPFDFLWRLENGVLYLGTTRGNAMSKVSWDAPWSDVRESIKRVIVEKPIAAADACAWFFCMKNLESIEGLPNLDTSRVTKMDHMFSMCKSLKELDLSGFDTSQVTTMDSMFWTCPSLTSLDLRSFNTSRVTKMGSMFFDCCELTSVDVSSFDTSSLEESRSMFALCKKLTALDISSFDLSHVRDASMMFSCGSALRHLTAPAKGFGPGAKTDDIFMGTSIAAPAWFTR